MRVLVCTEWPDAPADTLTQWGSDPACVLPIAGIPALAIMVREMVALGAGEVLVCSAESPAEIRRALHGVTGWRMVYPAPGGDVDALERLPVDDDLLCVSAAAWFSEADLRRLLSAGPDCRLMDSATGRDALLLSAETLSQAAAPTLRQLGGTIRSLAAKDAVHDITTLPGHRSAWRARFEGIIIHPDARVPASVRSTADGPLYIGPGAVVARGVTLRGAVEIGAGCRVGAGSLLQDAHLAPHTAAGDNQDLCGVTAAGALLWSEARDFTVRVEDEELLRAIPQVSASARRADRIERVLEATAAGLGLLMIAPILMLSAALIKLTSPGPVLYRSRRTVRPARTLIRDDAYLHDPGETVPYPVLRTMRVGADKATDSEKGENVYSGGPFHKYEGDQRVTRVGRILRKTSIDELPLLWEVVRGNLRLVGVWALPSKEAALLSDSEFPIADRDMAATARLRFGGRVGLGGLWQSQGRSKLSAESRALYDAWQMVTIHHDGPEPLPGEFRNDHTTLRRIRLVFETVWSAAFGRGAM